MLVLPRSVDTFPAVPDWTVGAKVVPPTEPSVLYNRSIYKPVGKVVFGLGVEGWRLVDSTGYHWVIPCGESMESMFRAVRINQRMR